ncbi:MAG TPA: hypothetical protein VKZ67_15555 [Natronosporangium sp.]|nr:hypothetical protein [Natronosporangium sp.]
MLDDGRCEATHWRLPTIPATGAEISEGAYGMIHQMPETLAGSLLYALLKSELKFSELEETGVADLVGSSQLDLGSLSRLDLGSLDQADEASLGVALGRLCTATFTLGVRRHWSPDVDIREVTAHLGRLCDQAWPDEGQKESRKEVDRWALEVLARMALGELYLAAETDPDTIGTREIDVLMAFVRGLDLSEAALAVLVREAESLVETADPLAGSGNVEHEERLVPPRSATPLELVSADAQRSLQRLQARKPSSIPAQYLRALALDDRPLRDELDLRMREAGEWEEPTTLLLFHHAGAYAVRLRFRPGEDIRTITAWVMQLRRTLQITHHPHMAFEAWVRTALRERTWLGGLSPSRTSFCSAICFMYIARELGLSSHQLDVLLSDVEAGRQPKPYPRVSPIYET